jgi:uncharacterized membrane protein HdeD (DUF308 family)
MGITPSASPFTGRAATGKLEEDVRRTRRWVMTAGVLSLLGGIAAIVLPNIASVATAMLIGWVLVLASATHVVDAFSTRDRTRMAVRLVLAALCFIAGVYLLVAPLDGTFTLTVVLAMWFLAIGVARIVIGIANRDAPARARALTVLTGVVALLLGLLIALGLPESAAWAVGMIVGVDLIFTGALLVALARALPKSPQ